MAYLQGLIEFSLLFSGSQYNNWLLQYNNEQCSKSLWWDQIGKWKWICRPNIQDVIEKFSGDSRVFISLDSAKNDTNNYYKKEYFNI